MEDDGENVDPAMLEQESSVLLKKGSRKKGKNFSSEEEGQLCRSFLHVSQDRTGNGSRNATFWDRVSTHYNCHRPRNCAARPQRSLETKWGTIKHDCSKFSEIYQSVVGLEEIAATADREDILQKALDLWRQKNDKSASFQFLHCWLILKDVPKWADVRDERRTTPAPPAQAPAPVPANHNEAAVNQMKRKSFHIEDETGVDSQVEADVSSKRPIAGRAAEAELKYSRLKESTTRSQARALVDMAAAILKQATVMEDQTAMTLFSMRDSELESEEAREYFKLRRTEELQKLKARLTQQTSSRLGETAARP